METRTSEPGQRRAELIERLNAGVARIMDSAEFAAFLAVQARFHRYSWTNALLIASQDPDATQVAGYRTWLALGRQVKQGEHGIRIFVPHRRKQTDDATGAETYRLTGFGVGTVFDIRQTDGEPLPTGPAVTLLMGEDARAAALEAGLRRLLAERNIPVKIGPMPSPSVRGYYDRQANEIALAPDLGGIQRAKTLAHEAAHALDSLTGSRADCETVAECAAYIVALHCGLDTGAQSFPYVANWALDKTTFTANLGRATAVAHQLIDALTPTDAAAGALGMAA